MLTELTLEISQFLLRAKNDIADSNVGNSIDNNTIAAVNNAFDVTTGAMVTHGINIGNFQFIQILNNTTNTTLDNSISENVVKTIGNKFDISAGDNAFAYGINRQFSICSGFN